MTGRNEPQELLYGLLALQMGKLRKQDLVGAVEIWLNDLDLERLGSSAAHRDLRSVLREQKLVASAAEEDVEAAVQCMPEAGPERGPAIEDDLRRCLLDLEPPQALRAWLLSLGARASQTPWSPVPREDRYVLSAEIGRGGLGSVFDAEDRDLGREVAIKVLRDGGQADAERFVREAKLTARLDHPNVVPVHDFGLLSASGGNPKLFLCMKRIRGRTLRDLVDGLCAGAAEARRTLSRARLLAIFQDVCLGVAYAHSRGIIHRDLKPANVMVGEFGETLVVDWGLAKIAGAPEEVTAEHPVRQVPDQDATQLTLAGSVLGTPAYMAPEQAEGRLEDVDARSDIYALGAILYVLLTWQLPWPAGPNPSTRRGLPMLPSERVAAEGPEGNPPVSPDLDAICLRAMAVRREDRFQSAMELHHEIQLFLEGVKDRERNHGLAEGAVAKAKAAMERQKRLVDDAKLAAEEAKKVLKELKPTDDKAALWAAQDRAKELEFGAIDAFGEANAELTVALGHEKEHLDARRLRAELHWKRYLEAEARDDEKEMRVDRAIVERYNDGPFDALLNGDGTLTVRTRAYPCLCLADGRTVKPEELAWQGYHPFSGRALDGHTRAEGLPALEPGEPVRLKVHAATCGAVALDGAEVWLFRYQEAGRRLMPGTPDFRATNVAVRCIAVPPAVVDALFEPSSPYRPQGPGLYLGRTPIDRQALPMGSYLLLVSHEGRAPQRVPVSIPRCGACEQEVTLFRPEEIPPGFIPIPAGAFGYQGDPLNPYAFPAETITVDDIFFARYPVTCREYAEFLNDLAKTRPEEAARRVPRGSPESDFYWTGPPGPERAEGPYAVPTEAWFAWAPAMVKSKARRLTGCPVDWEEDWPVFGVSWEDGMAYCAWKRGREARLTTLPHELEWEKSARGTDWRYFVWGRHWDDRWANANRSAPGGLRPSRVDEFSPDESPYGVRGLAGNSRDFCLNDPGPDYFGWRISRGGRWADSGINARATNRTGYTTRIVNDSLGFRTASVIRLSRTP
ncbi:MAG: serine/threonine protein kinase [Planctomycetota bacterium]|nr:MAG: serine/threonine protein kinase [Planctomycetota bacterium]